MSAKISKAVRDAIADPFALGDEQPPWTLPTVLPPIAEVREALTALRADLEPTPAKDARWCLGKMRQRFGIGSTEIDGDAWLKALTAFPRNMIFEAVRVAVTDDKRPTLEGFTRHPMLMRRQTDLARTEAILVALLAPKPVAPFKREAVEVRLRQCLNAALARRDTMAAADWERQLARAEGREPEAWAADMGNPTSARVTIENAPEIKPSPRTATLMLGARARWWRKYIPGWADRLEREADALAPEHVEEPLGDEHVEEAA